MLEISSDWKGLLTDVYAVTRSADALASAAGTAAWSGELPAVSKDKSAVLTAGRLQDEPSVAIACDGFHDMPKMIFHLPLGNAEKLRKLVGGEPGPGQESDQASAHRL